MELLKLAKNYADYNLWTVQNFTDWLSQKPDYLLHKEISSSFPSIVKTINHILKAESFWYSVLSEKPNIFDEGKVEKLVVQQLMDEWLKSAKRLSELIHSFSERDIIKEIKIDSPWFQCELPKYQYLMHVVNHATYHRGQLVTIGRNIGITDATNTDYNFYNVVNSSE